MQGHHRRLTHITTKNNLHTHGIKSPLSNQLKVTGFGNSQGDSDNGDDWRVMCSSGDEYWVRGEEVSFRKVFGRQQNDGHTKWKTEVGVYL